MRWLMNKVIWFFMSTEQQEEYRRQAYARWRELQIQKEEKRVRGCDHIACWGGGYCIPDSEWRKRAEKNIARMEAAMWARRERDEAA